MPADLAEELRARFVDLAPEGFEEVERADVVELAAYGQAAERVEAAFPDAAISEIEDGWEDRWREFHRPIRIGALWIGPPWESPPPGALPVIVDPGRAFGTGAHPSTRLCLELLLEQEPGSVLDVGCGSGVLAIAAAKLGFGPVTAVDLDELAVEVTRANADANGVSIESRVVDARSGELPVADLGIANISLVAVEASGPRLRTAHLITAGYLARDTVELAGFVRIERRELDGWAADLFART